MSIAGYLYFLFISQDIRPWKRSALARDWSEGTSKLYGSRIPAKWYNLQKTCLALMKLLNTLYMLENRVWQLLLRKYNVKLAKLLTKQSRKKGYCANIQKQLKLFLFVFWHIRWPFRISETKLLHTGVQLHRVRKYSKPRDQWYGLPSRVFSGARRIGKYFGIRPDIVDKVQRF